MAEETMLGKFYFYQVELRVFPVVKSKKKPSGMVPPRVLESSFFFAPM